jgi:hypothetical protein
MIPRATCSRPERQPGQDTLDRQRGENLSHGRLPAEHPTPPGTRSSPHPLRPDLSRVSRARSAATNTAATAPSRSSRCSSVSGPRCANKWRRTWMLLSALSRRCHRTPSSSTDQPTLHRQKTHHGRAEARTASILGVFSGSDDSEAVPAISGSSRSGEGAGFGASSIARSCAISAW